MDQIFNAIMAALPAIAAATATSVVKDSYSALKALLKGKWGADSEVTKTLESLEKEPHSAKLAADLQQQIALFPIHQDQDLQKAIDRLAEALIEAGASRADIDFRQSGGTFKGVGAIAKNTGNIRIE